MLYDMMVNTATAIDCTLLLRTGWRIESCPAITWLTISRDANVGDVVSDYAAGKGPPLVQGCGGGTFPSSPQTSNWRWM